jgi:hypothetical protein
MGVFRWSDANAFGFIRALSFRVRKKNHRRKFLWLRRIADIPWSGAGSNIFALLK